MEKHNDDEIEMATTTNDDDDVVDQISKVIIESNTNDDDDDDEKKERQPDLGTDENERVYLKPAARKAYLKVCNDTLAEFKRVTSAENEKYWQPLDTGDACALQQWSGPFRACDARKPGMVMLRVHGFCNVPQDRLIRMLYDDDATTRKWDPCVECSDDKTVTTTSPVVLDDFSDSDCCKVVYWRCPLPHWFSCFAVTQRAAITVMVHGKDWYVAQHIMQHRRHDAKKEPCVLMDGWCAVSMTTKNTLTMVVAINANASGIYEPLATQLHHHYVEMLKQRIPLWETVNKTWNYYYVN